MTKLDLINQIKRQEVRRKREEKMDKIKAILKRNREKEENK